MIYSMESFDYAIKVLLPKIAIAQDLGVNFDRPTLCSMVADQYFMDVYHKHDLDYSFKGRVCMYVIQEAMADLKELGQFNFGERDIKGEV